MTSERRRSLPSGFALRNEKIIAFAVLVPALLGLQAYFSTPQSIFPTMRFSRIDVVADAGDLPPDQVRIAVAKPLEQAFQELPFVTNVLSTSSRGSAELRVDFTAATNPRTDLQYVDQAIAQARASIPEAKNITAVVVNPNSEAILSYALTSPDLSQAVLRTLAQTAILPKLYGTPGLGRLLITGGPTTEYHVTLDPAKLTIQGIGAADVGKALADANAVRSVGNSERFYQRYAVIVDASLHDQASLEQVMIPAKSGASVPLASLGTVTLGVSPITNQASYNGQHAVVINAYGLAGADTVATATALRAKFAAILPRLPANVQIHTYWDQTRLIVASQSALRDAMIAGTFLAVVVIFLFLRSVRLTLVAAVMIPLAVAITLFILGQTGQTLNLMSVGGLAIAVGLIIDDAIVVIENIARNRREHPEMPADVVIALSMRQLTVPMIASSSAAVVIFLPLALLSGVAGFFFTALATTLAISLIVSLALALFLAPIIAYRLSGRADPHAEPDGRFLARYEPLLRKALKHRLLVGCVSIGIMLGTLALLTKIPSDFLPKMDEGQFEIAYTLPPGTSLSASDAAATSMERIVSGDPAVASVGRLTGIDSNGFSPTQLSQGLLDVRLIAPNQRENYDIVSARLRGYLETAVPASRYDFHQILEDIINGLSSTPAPIEISVHGNDQRTLISLAQTIAAKIRRIPGVVDTANGVVYNGPSLRISPMGNRLASLGLTVDDLSSALSALGEGAVVTGVRAQSLIPVRIQVASLVSGTPEPLNNESSLFAKGTTTALSDVASLTTVRLATDLNTQNGQPLLRVTANIQGASLSAVTRNITQALHEISFPPGYTAEIGGQAQTQKQSFQEFLRVIAIAVMLVFTVMLAMFRSFRLPLVILTAVPLALSGVAIGLAATGTPFNVSSFMGLLLLVGLIVKNGILLIDVANRRREEGASVEEALLVAGKTRLRPIVMTTLAAIGGLFPLALGIGEGAEMEKPLAVAVIGGLSTATIFTLIVIPVFYATFVGIDAAADPT